MKHFRIFLDLQRNLKGAISLDIYLRKHLSPGENVTNKLETFGLDSGTEDCLLDFCILTARHLYYVCNAFEWDTVEYATRHLYFPYTHEHVTSGMFHGIPRKSIA